MEILNEEVWEGAWFNASLCASIDKLFCNCDIGYLLITCCMPLRNSIPFLVFWVGDNKLLDKHGFHFKTNWQSEYPMYIIIIVKYPHLFNVGFSTWPLTMVSHCFIILGSNLFFLWINHPFGFHGLLYHIRKTGVRITHVSSQSSHLSNMKSWIGTKYTFDGGGKNKTRGQA